MNCPICSEQNRESAAFCDSCGSRLPATSGESALPGRDLGTPSGFVGRQRELGQLNTVLEDTLSGRGRLVMLVGEPGIGKTRTAQ
ncbi:MAG: AAA family ATPase, partial [Dehalococcoidia bacterium]